MEIRNNSSRKKTLLDPFRPRPTTFQITFLVQMIAVDLMLTYVAIAI